MIAVSSFAMVGGKSLLELAPAFLNILAAQSVLAGLCDTVKRGYQCSPQILHLWGQYSPYFAVESEISNSIPPGCCITFAQVLSRHGARDPTASKTASYNNTIHQLQKNVTSFKGKYAFLADYSYTLGADQLTHFGQQELVNSGVQFYRRYQELASKNIPFVRASSEERVVESAKNWTQGFHQARLADESASAKDPYPYSILVISEDQGKNNTLNHGLCTNFENGPDSNIGDDAQSTFADRFVPAITKRLNVDLPGAQLTESETISLMDLCPFNTVASPTGRISPFCSLFTEAEWHAYNYYETLGKFYGYGRGNPLGPTQGVGFVNELLARMTNTPVEDETSTNHTLDSNSTTFPTDLPLYADFSHDNDMTSIFFALGLYDTTPLLSNESIIEAEPAGGYSAAWTVPFAARAYFEKMKCGGQDEELVRIAINNRVVPLVNCGADRLGRCSLSSFVKSQSFSQSDGLWNRCFD